MNEEFQHDEYLGAAGAETTTVQMDKYEVFEALHNSCQFFLQFFLAEELEYDVPKFHIDSWELLTMEKIIYVALALPRGHAKTTLAKLCCVWYFLFTETRFIVYVSNTIAIAAEACKDIAAYLRSPNFVAVFGEIKFAVDQEARGFYKFTLQVPQKDGSVKEKFCILRAIGAGQQVRGMNIDNERPELAVVDDLEDDENTATPLLQTKLKKWFYGPFLKALSKKRRKVIYLGNMLSNQSLLYHFCEKSTQWHSIRYGALKSDGTPLWPEMWSLEDIRQDFVEYQKLGLVGQWFAEMMNMPIGDGQGLIAAEDIYYAAPMLPGEQEAAFITIDPAYSRKKWGNSSAIVVHGLKNGLWRIVEYITGKYSPDQLFYLTLGLVDRWNTRVVGVEAAGYQEALKVLFETLMEVNQKHFEVYMVAHHNRAKTERLAGWCSLIRKKQYALQEGDYAVTEQLLAYDPTKDANVDDLIDGCAMGGEMQSQYMPAIMEKYDPNPGQTYVPQIQCPN